MGNKEDAEIGRMDILVCSLIECRIIPVKES